MAASTCGSEGRRKKWTKRREGRKKGNEKGASLSTTRTNILMASFFFFDVSTLRMLPGCFHRVNRVLLSLVLIYLLTCMY